MPGGDFYSIHVPPLAEATDIARLWRHASHPVRLRLLYVLSSGERGISQLGEMLGVANAVVSQHIDTLLHAGLVKRKTAGNRGICTLTPAGDRVVEAYQATVLERLASAEPSTRTVPTPSVLIANSTSPTLATEESADVDANVPLVAAQLLNHAAHPLRLKLMFTLMRGERDSIRLTEELAAADLPTVSSHLSRLRSGSLVTLRHVGRMNTYRLTEAGRILARTLQFQATDSRLSVRQSGLSVLPESIIPGDDPIDPMSTEGLAFLLKAFAHPLRLRVLNLLAARQGVCDCHLFEIIEAPRSNVRYVLTYLKDNQVIAEERQSSWIHYHLTRSAQDLHRSLLGSFGARLAEATTFQNDHQRLLELSACTVRLESMETSASLKVDRGFRTA